MCEKSAVPPSLGCSF